MTVDRPWSFAERLGFRFVFAYFVLYSLPFPLDAIPYLEPVVELYAGLWNAVVPWVGAHVLRLAEPITVLPNGSGDTTYNYVQVACFLALAVLATVVWTPLDRGRTDYRRLHEWLRLYLRLSLATAMCFYGTAKVIPSQFPPPSLDRLVQPFGDASPMGLLWTFMGASTSYNVFAGAAEMLGGLLLVSRRTVTLGALVCIAAMANVVMLNFSYDVPVKLYSSHLLLVAIFLAAPDLKRLANLFVLNRATEPVVVRPYFHRRWQNRLLFAAQTAFVVLVVGYGLYQSYEGRTQFGDLAPRSSLHGVWSVEEFEVDGVARSPLVSDTARWKRVIFDYPGVIAVQLMSDSRQRYRLELDDEAKTLTLGKRDDPDWHATLVFDRTDEASLTLDGTMDDQRIRARLHRTDASAFLLRNRGFHWINEYPFNR